MSKLLLFSVLLSALLFINYYANPPDGYTGAPLNNEYSCSICHQTDINSPHGHSQIKGFPVKITSGEEYNLEVVVNCTDSVGKYSNFQLMIVDKDQSIGSLVKPKDYVKISEYKDREYAESKPAIKLKNRTSSFKFSWIAPENVDNKLITLYFTTIIANGDASFAGDRIIESKAIGVIGNSLDVSIEKQQNNLCPGDSSGYVKLSVTGGQKPYSFFWSNDETDQELYNLKSGDYFVTVTDKNGLLGVNNIKIVDPEKLKISSVTKQDITSTHKGSISIEATGGSGQYIYLWYKDGNIFSSNQNINDIAEGCYKVVVQDSCKSILDSTICISDFSSIEEAGFMNRVAVFPNPASDFLTIRLNENHLNYYNIVDISGMLVKSGKIKLDNAAIDITSLSPGLYYIIMDINNHRVVKNFMVDR